MEPDPRAVNQPSGSRDSLRNNPVRKSRANRASTTWSQRVRAAPSNAPRPSSDTAAMPTFHSRDAGAPDTSRRASSTSSTNGASCTSVMTACNRPDRISAERSGASNRPAAWARQFPRDTGAGAVSGTS